MKVIFLDIDGVLNCKKTSNPRKLPYVVDRRLLAKFKQLLERTGAKSGPVLDLAIRSGRPLQRQTLGHSVYRRDA
jgi:hypothetical protein